MESNSLTERTKQMISNLSGDEKKIVKKLERVLLEVRIPRPQGSEETQPEPLKEQVAVAEQLFTALHSIYRGGLTARLFEQDSISFEIAASNGQIGWYIGVPLHLQSLVEKQVHAYYPDAEITPVPMYNIFSRQGFVAATSLAFQKKNLYPIKTYQEFEADPMAGVAGALDKIAEGEGAAVQIMIAPTGGKWRKKGQSMARQYAQGKGKNGSFGADDVFGGIFKFGGELMSAATADPKQDAAVPNRADEPRKLTQTEEEFVEKIETKASKVGYEVVIRVVTAATDRGLAESNMQDITRAFAPYNSPDLNGFKERVAPVQSQGKLITKYVFRDLEGAGKKMIMNAEELAGLWHLPTTDVETPNVRWLGAKSAPPPSNAPKTGLLIGYNQYRGAATDIRMKEDDRRRHMYTVGKTGMGKTTLLKNMIIQD
ncbi:hypothetical protein EXS54_02270, partial [Patescibacteria group bacterium]|nr:hypothetical protein [Patescibacteria group bacterium]